MQVVVQLINGEVEKKSGSALVVFSKISSQKEKGAKITYAPAATKLKHAIEEKTVSGKAGEVVVYRELNLGDYRHVLVVGLGKENELDHENLRQNVASAYEALSNLQVTEAVVHFDGIAASKKDNLEFARAVAESFTLVSYKFDELKSQKETDPKAKSKDLKIHVMSKFAQEKALQKAFADGLTVAGCVNYSRRLGDLPGNLMTPKDLADAAVEAARGTKIKVTVWDKARIKKERFGGLLGVSNGSAQEPRFIIMEYNGGGKGKKPLVFVGKGLTFDCGGISIKPSAGMEEMKYDMCGGANVIGAMSAIARLGLKVNAIGLVPATENLTGSAATKPGDVHVARNGKSFEVNNTDAEGRLILSDALSYATELKPELIVDIATLTGAMVVALGNTHTGYFTRNKSLKNKIETASHKSGEWVWNMPLVDFHVSDMKGTYADLSNISSGKGAGSATAAAFLEQFVGEGIPWAHFDVAGTAWAVGNRLKYAPKKGASGVMIRTFIELARQHE